MIPDLHGFGPALIAGTWMTLKLSLAAVCVGLILGLLGAALGLRREDAAGLATLDPIRMAVGVHDEGAPMRDFHTVTSVPSAAAKRPDSRPAALRAAGRDAGRAANFAPAETAAASRPSTPPPTSTAWPRP